MDSTTDTSEISVYNTPDTTFNGNETSVPKSVDSSLNDISISVLETDQSVSGESSEQSDSSSSRHKPWYDSITGKYLPQLASHLETSAGDHIYLLGTIHFSTECADDVSTIIQAVNPRGVLVELCESRIQIMLMDEKTLLEESKSLDFSKMRQVIAKSGLISGLLLFYLFRASAEIAQKVKIGTGGEFRRAYDEVQKRPDCTMSLIDRPLGITIRRAISLLSWWESFKMLWSFLTERSITKEDIQELKDLCNVNKQMEELSKDYPAMRKTFVDERDTYMAFCIKDFLTRLRCREQGPLKVVGIVGLGHVAGILSKVESVTKEDVAAIMVIPPPTLATRMMVFTVKASLLGIVVYGVTRIGPIRRSLPSAGGLKTGLLSLAKYIRF